MKGCVGMNTEKEKINIYQRVYAEIDLDAIENNMENMKANMSEHAKMFGVIKMDGYGHGSVPIAQCMEEKEYVYGYAVATADEAHVLRGAGMKKPILVLGYTFPDSYEMLAQEEIRPAVFREDTIAQLSEAAKRTGKTIKVHIKVDTGMGRIGIAPNEEGLQFVEKLMQAEGIEIEGIFTHFARADELDKTAAKEQYAAFTRFIGMIEDELQLQIPMKHCSNSAAIVELPEMNMDAVRCGIILYGLYPSEEVSKEIVKLQPALSLYSHVVYLKTIHAGQSVSYGATFTADKDMKVATIPVGYGDGYPRSLSNKGYVLIHGQKAPILGRVCMDQFMVDVSHIPELQEGDKVTLIGRDGEEHISAELLGDMSGRFNYELVCDLNKRIPRVYIRHGEVVSTKDYNDDWK